MVIDFVWFWMQIAVAALITRLVNIRLVSQDDSELARKAFGAYSATARCRIVHKMALDGLGL